MIDKMVGGAINALVGALKVVVLFGDPRRAGRVGEGRPRVLEGPDGRHRRGRVALVSWVCDLIVGLIPKELTGCCPSAGRGPPVLEHGRPDQHPSPELPSHGKARPSWLPASTPRTRTAAAPGRPARRPSLALVPAPLAAVLPMPRPRPGRPGWCC